MTVTTDVVPSGPQMTFAAAITDALDIALELDENAFVLGQDIADPGGGVFGVTKGLSTKYGIERVRPTPISEQAIVGAAIGAAAGGMRPVAEIMFFDLFAVCLDQIVNHAAKMRYMTGGQVNLPLTIRTAVAAGFGTAAQHSQSLEAWLMHVPGLKVAFPSNPADAKGLLLTSIFTNDPCIFVEHASLYYAGSDPVPEGDYRIPFGQARIVRPGRDLSVVTYGKQVNEALTASETLSAEGIDVEIIDLRTIVPLDWPTVIESVRKTRRAMVVHEAVRTAGVGAEIASTINERLFGVLQGPVVRVGAPTAPAPGATSLDANYFPGAREIVDNARRAMGK